MIGEDGAEAERGGEGKPAYTVVGFLDEAFGLAVASRNTVRALGASGRRVAPIRVRHDHRVAEAPAAATDAGSVTVFHMNPHDVAAYAAQWRGGVDPRAPSVCVPFWEMPLVPRAWVPILEAMDAVLAPTRFIQAACEQALPAGRVVHHPQAVFLPEVREARAEWGLPSATTVFLLSFDIGSDIERKNPWAGVEAFRQAFPPDANVALVVKTKPYPTVPSYRAQARELAARTQGDARIRIVEQALGYDELLRLHLMEAMSLGKPVVATGWSGNMDFMSPESSIAVGHRLVPVKSNHPGYVSELGREGQVWADADVDEAARALRALHEDRSRRLVMGAAAAREMELRRKYMLSGAAFDALEAALPSGGAPDPRRFARAIRDERARLRWATLRRRARMALRLLVGRGPR